MDFSITCSCGKRITVTAAHAGAQVPCLCGKLNEVPSLSELRHAVGQVRYNLGIVDRIRQKVDEGVVPSESVCAKCGAETGGTLYSFVECERTWNTEGGFWKHFFLILLLPVWIWDQLRRDYGSPDVLGRETVVETPLRMCPECQSMVRNARGTRALLALLQKVPLYQELLREYPHATISVSTKQR